VTDHYAARSIFDERGFLLLPIASLKPSLYRLFKTSFFLHYASLRRRVHLLVCIMPHRFWRGAAGGWGALTPHRQRVLDLESYRLAVHLPERVLAVLSDVLQVRVFGETARFDHLDFASWFNGLTEKGTLLASQLYDAYGPLFDESCQSSCAALDQWISDLSAMGELIDLLRVQCRNLTGFKEIRAEHVHLKSWQARGYKAQWWHLDRGEISAIGTIAGQPTTEFLLSGDPAPYPEKPPTDDVFVFPEFLDQPVHQCPSDDLLMCGARARKEDGQSYLWHRAPASAVERVVLVLKTLPRPTCA